MNIKSIVFTSFIIIIFFSCQQTTSTRQIHTPDAELLIPEIVRAVQENHFHPRLVDDALSQDMFEYYLERLDPQKEFFTQEDILHLGSYKLTLDEAVTNNNFEFFNTAVSLLENGIAKAEKYSNELLNDPFDFSVEEILEINFSKLSYATNDRMLKDRWRKKIKKYLLDQMYLEEKNNPSLPQDQLVASARKKVEELLTIKINNLKNIKDAKRVEEYANAFLKVHDYQSQYLSPKEKTDWDVNFTRSFVGIGTQLVIEDGYPKVTEVIIGGPAWKAKSIKVNDIILKIKDKNRQSIDLIGKPIAEVISLIKGKKGTSVHLTIKRKDTPVEEVEIVRDKIEFDLAMSFLLEDNQAKQKIGYIRLPRFYAGDPGSATHVLNEINILKANNVEGIIFDVRNNKGGSARECRTLLDYFLEEGIYAQTKRSDGAVNQYFGDDDSSVQYKGKLLVLTNSRSGSASELFSGTLQDYKRAIIVGGKSTFGKGSMQNFIEINPTDSTIANSKFGQIKMSVGLFYTASGRSPQSTGIIPDIILTDDSKYAPSGERAEPFSMPADALPKTEVSQNVNVVKDIDQLKVKSDKRTKNNKAFLLADKKAKHLLKAEESNLVALNINAYKEQKESEVFLKEEWEAIFSDINSFEVSFDRSPFAQDSASIINREMWVTPIRSDPYIYECYQIINDMAG